MQRRALLGLAAGLAAAPARSRSTLQLYSYHLKPPYLFDDKARQGLWPSLLPLLEQRLRRPLRLSFLPRLRIVELLDANRLDGLVLGVSPLWFERSERYRWTPPLLDDADLLLSHRELPLSAAGLQGRRLALPRGYRIPSLQLRIDAGDIGVEEPDSERSALAMLLHRRVDAAVLTEQTLRALLKDRPTWREALRVDPRPLGRYQLGLLVPPALEAEHGALSEALRQLQHDPAWAGLQRRFLGPAGLLPRPVSA